MDATGSIPRPPLGATKEVDKRASLVKTAQGRKINLAAPSRKASVRESIGSTKIACAIATTSVSENMDQAGPAKAAVQRSREENREASVARMKCNEIRGTEPPSISLRDRGYDIYSLRCFLADAGWVSGNKTHRPELRTPLA